MSRIDDLIADRCPNGVERKALGEIAELVRGNGMPRADFVDSGVGCIHYGQIYMHYGTWATETLSFISTEKASRLAKVDPGDLIVTNTSENLDDVCKAVAWLGDGQIVTGGHATVLKHDQDPKYLAYYLQTAEFARAKKKFVTGTKVMDVSAKNLAKIRIPVPPLEVQRAIVSRLDEFSELEAKLKAELGAELQARQSQYSHYQEALLGCRDRDGVAETSLGEVGVLFGGLTGKSKIDFQGGNARFVSYSNVYRNLAVDLNAQDRVSVGPDEKQRRLHRGDILFTGSSEVAAECGISSVVTAEPAEPLYLNSFCIGYRLHDPNLLLPDFAKHLFRSEAMRHQIVRTASGVTRFNVSKAKLAKVVMSVPPLQDQERIARVLDRFDALVNSLSLELRAELAARRQQFQYHRDQLFTFSGTAA